VLVQVAAPGHHLRLPGSGELRNAGVQGGRRLGAGGGGT
jgi:hypothetical protein